MQKGDTLYLLIVNHPFIRYNGSIGRLKYLLSHFPQVFTVYEDSDGSIELSYNTKVVATDVTQATNDFEIRAWERGLKHSGFVLIQKHPNPVKVWKVKTIVEDWLQ